MVLCLHSCRLIEKLLFPYISKNFLILVLSLHWLGVQELAREPMQGRFARDCMNMSRTVLSLSLFSLALSLIPAKM